MKKEYKGMKLYKEGANMWYVRMSNGLDLCRIPSFHSDKEVKEIAAFIINAGEVAEKYKKALEALEKIEKE